MHKRRVFIMVIMAIVTIIGSSYALWKFSCVQLNINMASSSCFNLSFQDQNDINLLSAYPMTDEEGKRLTPYQFTITNNCSEYASYQVNLEILNDNQIGAQFIKSEFNDVIKLVSAYATTTKTVDNAMSAYKLIEGYLDAHESIIYTLGLWMDEAVTPEDNLSNKIFSSKVTVTTNYLNNPSDLQKCIHDYGEDAAVCQIVARATPNDGKCLHTDSTGRITDYSTTMSDSDTPLVCSMEDDYGTSYYLRGLHTTNNVKFADMCWKILRTTGNGGLKLLYNGDVDANGNCTKTSGTHKGFTYETISLNVTQRLYGTSYTKSGSTYTLKGTTLVNYNNNSYDIIGKYTCGSTSSTCNTLYYVFGYYSSGYANVIKLDQNTNYAQIGMGVFNSPVNKSLSDAGYMYNDNYTINSKSIVEDAPIVMSAISANSTNYYYGDTLSYSDGYYYITNQDGSDVVQLDWASNYQNNLVGKYTCRSTTTYNSTTLRCSVAYKVVDTTTKANYMITEYLNGGRTSMGTFYLASSYTFENGNYVLTNPVGKTGMEWYSDSSSLSGYFCKDWNLTTCTTIYKYKATSSAGSYIVFNSDKDYYYGSSFTYNENSSRPYTLTNTIQSWEGATSLNTHHYTCFNASDNSCDKMYYISFYNDNPNIVEIYYTILQGDEKVGNAIDKMLYNEDVNVIDSSMKIILDWWYKSKFLNTSYENYLDDTVFCSDRTIALYAGWSASGNLKGNLFFNSGNNKFYLKCPKKEDSFTVDDIVFGNGDLIYPIGLITETESILLGNKTAKKTGATYWTMSPGSFYSLSGSSASIASDGGRSGVVQSTSSGIRPVLSLKPGIKFVDGGNGTTSNPYVVDMSNS